MNAPVTIPACDQTLFAAYVQKYRSDPKLAYGEVTGACVWPPANGDDFGSLAIDADKMIATRADDGITLEVIRLCAASAFFGVLDTEEPLDPTEQFYGFLYGVNAWGFRPHPFKNLKLADYLPRQSTTYGAREYGISQREFV